MIRIEYATAETWARSGADECHKSSRGIVAIHDDGQIAGVAGVFTDGHRLVLFANLTDTLRADKRAIIKAARLLKTIFKRCHAPVHSLADPDINGSRALLEHVGFKPLVGDMMQWHF